MTSTTSRAATEEAPADFEGLFGSETPRLWTRPLRELTPETSLGFEVIEFALLFLGIDLYPWQKWLLIHALELNVDGTFRFRRVIVLVARQNGKSLLAAVLAAWWLFVDSDRFEERLPPFRFKVLGTAQNLDTAQDVWNLTGRWCDKDNEEGCVPALARAVAKIQRKNGQPGIYLRNGAHYEVRAASRKGGRGKTAARVLMDEMREQQTWDAWDSVAQTTKAIFNSQLWGISNAGDVRSVVLRKMRDNLIADIEAWLARGIDELEAYANGELQAPTSALFEWSAPDGCALDDVDAILQANPSIGHGEITIEQCLQDARDMLEASYRTEVLCQWVTSAVKSFISPKEWRLRHTSIPNVLIPRGARTVWAVDTAADRSMTWIAAGVLTESGRPFTTVRHRRAGMMWLPDYLEQLAIESDCWEVVVQGRGCPAVEFIDELEKRGFTVHKLDGGQFAIATGRMRDRVRDGQLVVIEQPDIDLAVEGGIVTHYAENLAWSRTKSQPVDIAGLVAMTEALYALEVLTPPEPEEAPPPPPAAESVRRTDVEPNEVNIAHVAF